MDGIHGSVAVVTGGSTGIGRAAALKFAEEGASVVIGDVNVEEAEKTVSMIEEAGGEATFVETDISEEADVARMVDTAVETYGGLNFAFNNAGIEGESDPMADQTMTNWDRVIDTNLKGVFQCMRAEIPAMLETSGGGAIVNTSSIAGEVAFPDIAPYVASKHGVVGLTKNAALEYSAQGIRVNAVLPGVIDTPMVDRSRDGDPEMIEQVSAATPIGRIGQPEEIGDAAVWLCSEEASFVTGESMVVDGGYTIQ